MRHAPGAEEDAGAAELASAGVEILPPLLLARAAAVAGPAAKLLHPKPEYFYPDIAHGARIAAALADWRADALLVPWSEWVTAACSTVPVLRFAYYGNPDHKAGLCRFAHDRRLGGSLIKFAQQQIALKRLEQAHLKIMRRYPLLGDVAANDAASTPSAATQTPFIYAMFGSTGWVRAGARSARSSSGANPSRLSAASVSSMAQPIAWA